MNRRQFGSGLLGTVGVIGLNRLARGTPSAPHLNPLDRTYVRFTFAGLLVFHPMNGIFELGVLRARGLGGGVPDHIFGINIVPSSGAAPPPLDLESYVQKGDTRWSLDVINNVGNAMTGVQATLQTPANRHESNKHPKDFGWMVNIEGPDFHANPLPRLRNRLKPIITLNYGGLNTACKTESVDLIHGSNQKIENFGFIAGATELLIDTSFGEKVVLKTQTKSDILNLKPGISYDIEVLNAPPSPLKKRTRSASQAPPPPAPHFHLYYHLLFTRVGPDKEFSFKSNSAGNKPDDYCPSVIRILDPDPYKCGGVTLNEGGDPLN